MEDSKEDVRDKTRTEVFDELREKQKDRAVIQQGDALSAMAKSVDELVAIYAKDKSYRQDETYEVTFKLENIEDLQMLSRYKDAFLFIEHFQNYLRTQWKYAETPDDIDTIYDKYCDDIVEYGVNFD